MNEYEFRQLVRDAVGQSPPPPSGERLRAFLFERSARRRQRIVAAAAFGLAVVVVAVLLGGYRLLSVTQHPTTPAANPVPTATAPATPVATTSTTPTPAPTTPQFTSFTLSSFANPGTAAVVGPDGAVWYTIQNDAPRIGRISSTG